MTLTKLNRLGLASWSLVLILLAALLPAGAAAQQSYHPKKAYLRLPTILAVSQVEQPVAAPTEPLIAQATVTPSPTPRPTMSGTQPPATIPPTPSPPAPTTPTPVPATQFGRVYSGANAALRFSPSSTAGIVIKVPRGQIAGITGYSLSGSWYKATYRGKSGYVPVSRLQTVNLVGRTLSTQYARIIVVARIQQHVEVWERGKLMLISAVTTGRPDLPTPLGWTKVLKKESPHLFQSPWNWPSIYWYPPGWADFAVLFRSGGFYFHDTHYRPPNGFGIGTNVPHIDPDGVERTGSRGCVNTPYWAVRSIYGWAQLGDPVVVLDR